MKITMNATLKEDDVVNPSLSIAQTCGITQLRGAELLSHVGSCNEDNMMLSFMHYVQTLTDQEKMYLMVHGYKSLWNLREASASSLASIIARAMQQGAERAI